MKNQKMKKAMSLALAGVMAMSLSVTAFALPGSSSSSGSTGGSTSGSTGGSTTTPATPGATETQKSLDFDTVLQAPTIEVEMTANNAIIMNPYMLKYTDPVSNEEVEGTDIESLVTAVNVITSKTLAPLDVDVTITSTAPDSVSFASNTISTTSTDKEVFVQFAMQGSSDDDVTTPTWDTSASSWTATATANWGKKTEVAKTNNKAALITLDGSEQVYGEDDDPFYVMAAAEDAENPVYAAFKLVGACNEKSEESWTAADKVDVAVAFTFNIMSNGQLSAT